MTHSLSVRANEAKNALFERYDELNTLWEMAEKKVTTSHIPHPVEIEYETIEEVDHAHGRLVPKLGYLLGIQKYMGKWRICHASRCHGLPFDDAEWTPITECSAAIRVSAAAHVASLHEKLVESVEEFVTEVDEAITTLRIFLRGSIGHMLAERAKLNRKQ